MNGRPHILLARIQMKVISMTSFGHIVKVTLMIALLYKRGDMILSLTWLKISQLGIWLSRWQEDALKAHQFCLGSGFDGSSAPRTPEQKWQISSKNGFLSK